jgi:hypothetical protein
MVALADEHLDAGDALGAVRLCEMALANDPTSRAALETFLAGHEQLLAEHGGENFWLTGWLEYQVNGARSLLEVLPEDG